ncbi:BACON domain-containing protein [Pseudaquabacterium rugosum]|uniref:BACON domain-containing protein n=1 Tax=Pseudaquabacterium rugosum TaxID=2984194 RepID=A0ABU9B5F7_9BURK
MGWGVKAAGRLVSGALVLLVGCGGGGGGGGGTASGSDGSASGSAPATGWANPQVQVPVDSRLRVASSTGSVALAYDEGSAAAPAGALQAVATGDARGGLYVGATTPSGQADPNIDRVAVQVTSASASGGTAAVQIQPRLGLAAGRYTGTVLLLACPDSACSRQYAGSPLAVAYTLTVAPRPADALVASPTSLTLSGYVGEAATAPLQVQGGPAGETTAVSAGASWLTATPLVDGRSTISATATVAGTYSSQLVLTAGARRTQVPVVYTALPRHLALGTAQASLSATSGQGASATVAIARLAGGATSYSVQTQDSAWLTVAAQRADSFDLQVASLPAGVYTGSVSVRSGDDLVLLPVRYTVAAPPGGERQPAVAVTSPTLTAAEGGRSASLPLGLTRASWNPEVRSAIAYATGGPVGWLSLGTSAAGDLLLQADARALAAGRFSATVTLTPAWPAQPLTLPVSLTVGPGLSLPAAQTATLDSETTAERLTGSLTPATLGATALRWSASSDAAWLQLTRDSGTLGDSVAWRIAPDLAQARGGDGDLTATITVRANAAESNLALTPVTTRVTLQRALGEVHGIGPGTLVAGQAASVIVRGRGMAGLADPAARLSIGTAGASITPTRITRLGDAALRVDLPALPAGNSPVCVGNALGLSTPCATLTVLAPQTLPAAGLVTGGSLPSGNSLGGLVHDARRGILYLANRGTGAIQRWADGRGLSASPNTAAEVLALPELDDIALSPDGQWLVATERNGRLHLIDPAGFTLSASYTAPGPFFPVPAGGHGLAITNDGRVWLTVGGGWNAVYSFNLRTRQFTRETLGVGGDAYYGGPWFEVSRNGERLVAVQSASQSPAPPLLVLDNSQSGGWRANPVDLSFFYWSMNGLDDQGTVLQVMGGVWDAQFNALGRVALPDAGWTHAASVLSPDGQRLYVHALPPDWTDASSTVMPRVYVFDTTVRGGPYAALPLLARWDLPAYATCHTDGYGSACLRPQMSTSADGRSLFIAGTVRLLVVPVPQPLPGTVDATPTSAAATLLRRTAMPRLPLPGTMPGTRRGASLPRR